MLVKNWMTENVVTITPERSMMKASKLMKDHGISRLPVVDESGRIVGIVSDRDIKDASPSKATTLDMHELYYLLSEVKIKDIMTKKVTTIRDDETVEKAAVLMLEGNFGGLPVVDGDARVVGIITDTDIFKVLVEISGVYEGGVQVCLQISTGPGSLAPVLDYLKENGGADHVGHDAQRARGCRLQTRLHPHARHGKARPQAHQGRNGGEVRRHLLGHRPGPPRGLTLSPHTPKGLRDSPAALFLRVHHCLPISIRIHIILI